MSVITNYLEYKSEKFLEFKDITVDIEKIVRSNKIMDGQVLIYSPHTTMSIKINEKEKGICNDFTKLMRKLIPKDEYYEHNDLTKRTENLVCEKGASDCMNGHSHCMHLLMNASETIPIIDGNLMLGCWQRIFAIELDCARKRKIIVQITGK